MLKSCADACAWRPAQSCSQQGHRSKRAAAASLNFGASSGGPKSQWTHHPAPPSQSFGRSAWREEKGGEIQIGQPSAAGMHDVRYRIRHGYLGSVLSRCLAPRPQEWELYTFVLGTREAVLGKRKKSATSPGSGHLCIFGEDASHLMELVPTSGCCLCYVGGTV